MDTPRKSKLYNRIAKDYRPKEADMMICKHIEGLETRLEELEAALKSAIAQIEEAASARAGESTGVGGRTRKNAPDPAQPLDNQ